jgi:hypothetical protein
MKPGTQLYRINCRLPATVIVFAFIVEDLVRSRLTAVGLPVVSPAAASAQTVVRCRLQSID